MKGRRFDRPLPSYWPEAFVTASWLVLFLATDLVFRDDESVVHRAMHLGLWVSLACYVAVALREHRTAKP